MTINFALAVILAAVTPAAPVEMKCRGTASYPATTMALPYGLTTTRPGLSVSEEIEIRQEGTSLRIEMPSPMTPRNYLGRVDVDVEAELEGTSLLGRGAMHDDSPVIVALDQQSGEVELKGRHGTFSGRCVSQEE
jgi:hypothetical protein